MIIKTIFYMLIFLVINTSLYAEPADQDFEWWLNFSKEVVDATDHSINSCGLMHTDPANPLLRYPGPRVPADRAIANKFYQLLAVYSKGFLLGSGGFAWVYMNPNGGYKHYIKNTPDRHIFVTPYSGIVASATKVTTSVGANFVYRCKGLPVDFENFKTCVYREFSYLISYQLCRYALHDSYKGYSGFGKVH